MRVASEMPRFRDRHSAAGHPSSFQLNPDEHLALVSSSALFIGLTQREYAEIISCGRVLTYARNELLYAQGHPMCQHRLKIPHYAGRKFLHPGLVYDCSRLIDDETGW
jgi:hypothetical protein